nr:MAG TPA: hypothetical protein [Caudoviricetes sp.]
MPKGAQIGSCGLGCFLGCELSRDCGGLPSASRWL